MTITNDDLNIELEAELEFRELSARIIVLQDEIEGLDAQEAELLDKCPRLMDEEEWELFSDYELAPIDERRMNANTELHKTIERLAQL